MSISSAQKLAIYNGALLVVGERKLATLTDEIESRRLLDTVWGDDDSVSGVKSCLEAGQWNFAMRSAQMEVAETEWIDDNLWVDGQQWVEEIPEWGHVEVFQQPGDMVRICAICEDEFFNVPLLQYREESGLWLASIDPIYIRYVSDGEAYGKDFGKWPESFTRYVEAYFAARIVWKLTQDEKKEERAEKIEEKRLKKALSIDAMQDATAFKPLGIWQLARGAGTARNRDGGKRNQLIG